MLLLQEIPGNSCGFRVSGFGVRVSGFGFRVQGFGEGLRSESRFILILSAVSLLFGAYRKHLHPMIRNGSLIYPCLIKKIDHLDCNQCKQSCKILSSKSMHEKVYNLLQIQVDNLQKILLKNLYLSLQIVSIVHTAERFVLSAAMSALIYSARKVLQVSSKILQIQL